MNEPKHPLPWKQSNSASESYVEDSTSRLIGAAYDNAEAAKFCAAANAISAQFQPRLVSEHGLPNDDGLYVFYYPDGDHQFVNVKLPSLCGSINPICVTAWIKLPELPVIDPCEAAWEKCKANLPGSGWSLSAHKEIFRAGFEVAKGAK